MKARLVKNENKFFLLMSSGEIINAGKNDLRNMFMYFKQFPEKFIESQHESNFSFWNVEYPEITAYPGETYAYITDALQLVIINSSPFMFLFESIFCSVDNLCTVAEYATLYNKSFEQVKVLCRTGRIPGAKKIGRDWVIPSVVPYPLDQRFK